MRYTREKQFIYVGESIPNDLGSRRIVRESGEAFHASTTGTWDIYDADGISTADGALPKSPDAKQFDIFVANTVTAGLAPGDYTFQARITNPVTGFAKVVETFELTIMAVA